MSIPQDDKLNYNIIHLQLYHIMRQEADTEKQYKQKQVHTCILYSIGGLSCICNAGVTQNEI